MPGQPRVQPQPAIGSVLGRSQDMIIPLTQNMRSPAATRNGQLNAASSAYAQQQWAQFSQRVMPTTDTLQKEAVLMAYERMLRDEMSQEITPIKS